MNLTHTQAAGCAPLMRSQSPTDAERLAWLVKHVSYLEHASRDGTPAVKVKQGSYWPQADDDCPGACVEALVGLGLIEYIDAMIQQESV